MYVAGHTAIDHICKVKAFPPKNGSVPVLDRQIYFGGGAGNIAAGIARLGGKCTLISAVGEDFAGSSYERWMEELGITRQFFVVEGTRTATAFLFTDEAGDQITFFEWGASRIFPSCVAPALPFVHLATADPDFNTRLATQGDFVSFDPGQDLPRYSRAQLESIIGNTNILFANHHEVAGMCSMMECTPDELASRVPIAVFTEGGAGSILHAQGIATHIPAVDVHMHDPTGAGDAYRAGFLVAYHHGYSPLVCARIGTTTASFVVEVVGCQTNLPTWAMMAKRYCQVFGDLPHRGD
jgi:sugar/nucleoside kinase (ribokinase family)